MGKAKLIKRPITFCLPKGKASQVSTAHNLTCISSLALGLGLAIIAIAAPGEYQITDGDVNITRPDSTHNTTQIMQGSSRAVIDWKSFNIDKGETVNFEHVTGDRFTTLNRVQGGMGASQILGSITSKTGNIWILNADGVHFGQGSTVDVASILVSTYNISNENFMSGNYNFEEFPGATQGRIYNAGEIKVSGLAALLSHDVENVGIIRAQVATVLIGSNPTWVLDAFGDDTINFAVSDELLQRKATVSNSGEIYADGGRVFLSVDQANEVVENAINLSGIVRADSVEMQNGIIVLSAGKNSIVNVTGELTATGLEGEQSGGLISVLSDFVTVLDDARIDVSGMSEGGEILVGGDYQGQGFLPTATNTYIDINADLTADSYAGDAGRIIVWADDDTQFHGKASASALGLFGDGGFVETSGKNTLNIDGARVSASSVTGEGGAWLLDPTDFTVNSGNDGAIESALGGGTDVTVQSTDGLSGVDGDVIFDASASISWTNAAGDFFVYAINDIKFESGATLTADAASNISLIADSDSSGSGTLSFPASGTSISATNGASVYGYYNPTGGYVSPDDSTFDPRVNVTGGGEEIYYMLVHDVFDLQLIEDNLSGDYALSKNLDATDGSGLNVGAGFEAIGTNANGFSGRFNGSNYIIDNLTITASSGNLGLFGYVDGGVISNVGLTNVDIDNTGTSSNTGALVGRVLGETSIITNAYSTGSVDSGGNKVGGLIGRIDTGVTVTDSYSDATVSGREDTGGFVGYLDADLSGVYATGDVTGSESEGGSGGGVENTGGLVGFIDTGASGDYNVLEDSYATGSVSGNHNVGGLVGSTMPYVDIRDSYAAGLTVTAPSGLYVGGLVGRSQGASLALQNKIHDSYSTADVSASGFVGGLLGHSAIATDVAYSFASGDVSSNALNGVVGGLVGYMQSNSMIRYSYATGNVTANVVTTSGVGGLVGQSGGSTSFDNEIENSYAAGTVTHTGGSATNTGALVGYNSIGDSLILTGSIALSNPDWQLVGTSSVPTFINYTDRPSGLYSLAELGDTATFVNPAALNWNFTNSGDGYDSATTEGIWIMADLPHLQMEIGFMETTANNYEIDNVIELQLMAVDLDGDYVLSQDFSASATETWGVNDEGFNPVGFNPGGPSIGNRFSGTLNGNYHTIDGLTISRSTTENVGLFGVGQGNAGVMVSNLNLTSVNIKGKRYVGALFGSTRGNPADINNVFVEGAVTATLGFVGGLVGDNEFVIRNSLADVFVSSTGVNAGGLVGKTIDDIFNSAAIGKVVSSSSNVGGLVGGAGEVTFMNVYARGDVHGTSGVGGLIGGTFGSAGVNPRGKVINAYATGVVTKTGGSTSVGGLVGSTGSGKRFTYEYTYWNNSVGSDTSVGLGGSGASQTGIGSKSTEQLYTQSTYEPLDSTWNFTPGTGDWFMAGYPVLQMEINHMKTGDNAYEISNVQELQMMALDLSGNYTLTQSFSAAETTDWNGGAGFNPIGNASNLNQYTGVFDGAGYEIDSFRINRSQDYVGLFGYVSDATIKNIGLTNVDIDVVGDFDFQGGLIGRAVGSSANKTLIENVFVTGDIDATSGDGTGFIIGDTGINNTGGKGYVTLRDSYSSGAITGYINVGGLIGRVNSGGVDIDRVHSTADISAQTGSNLGGIVGFMHGDDDGPNTLSDSYFLGSIIAPASAGIGGIVGLMQDNSVVSNVYTAAIMSGSPSVGAIYGFADSDWNGSLSNAYWDVESTGIGSVESSFGAIETSFSSGSLATTVLGKSSADMKKRSTFFDTGWDIEVAGGTGNAVWQILEGFSYPRFNSEGDLYGISGKVFSDAGSSAAVGESVSLLIGGSILSRSTATNGSGDYTFAISSREFELGGDDIIIHTDATNFKSNTVIEGGDIQANDVVTGVDLWGDTVSLQEVGATMLGLSFLNDALNGYSSDDILYDTFTGDLDTLDANIGFRAANVFTLGNNITTDAGSIYFDGDLILSDDVSLNTGAGAGAGDIKMTGFGDIDGNHNLVLDAGAGEIVLNEGVGNTNPLLSFVAKSAVLKVEKNITVDSGGMALDSAIEVTGSDVALLSGGDVVLGRSIDSSMGEANNLSIESVSGKILLQDNVGSNASFNMLSFVTPVELRDDIVIAAETINFNAEVTGDSPRALTVDAGEAGTIRFGGSVGSLGTPIALSVPRAAEVLLEAPIEVPVPLHAVPIVTVDLLGRESDAALLRVEPDPTDVIDTTKIHAINTENGLYFYDLSILTYLELLDEESIKYFNWAEGFIYHMLMMPPPHARPDQVTLNNQ